MVAEAVTALKHQSERATHAAKSERTYLFNAFRIIGFNTLPENAFQVASMFWTPLTRKNSEAHLLWRLDPDLSQPHGIVSG